MLGITSGRHHKTAGLELRRRDGYSTPDPGVGLGIISWDSSKETQVASQVNPSAGLADIHPGRLFVASCMSLIVTAVTFAIFADIMGALKQQFVLTNEQVGWIIGAGTWGFTLSIFVLGPLCDALSMRLLMRFALVCHVVGVSIMILTGTSLVASQSWDFKFWMLFTGALVVSLGNGTVEAACNPLIATIFPDAKTQKLNRFHMWFPGGIVMGGLAGYLISQSGFAGVDMGSWKFMAWQLKLVIILVPAVIYGILFTGQKFPATERVQSGISFGGMVKETLLRPFFIILFFCMMITASLELAPQRWIPSVLESGGIPGILVLVWITGLMAILRFFAGPVVHRLSNTGVLLMSAILAGVGLVLLSFATSIVMAGVAATIFAVGVCYFWPTMLGTAAERVPKGGALALALLGGIGMLVVGVVTTPQMGKIADTFLHKELDPNATSTVLADVARTYPQIAAKQPQQMQADYLAAAASAQAVVKSYEAKHVLPEGETASALREAIKIGGGTDAGKSAKAILGPADNKGGLMSFRYVAPLSLVLIVVFGLMYLHDRKRGGYKAEKIIAQGLAEGFADGVGPDQLKK